MLSINYLHNHKHNLTLVIKTGWFQKPIIVAVIIFLLLLSTNERLIILLLFAILNEPSVCPL